MFPNCIFNPINLLFDISCGQCAFCYCCPKNASILVNISWTWPSRTWSVSVAVLSGLFFLPVFKFQRCANCSSLKWLSNETMTQKSFFLKRTQRKKISQCASLIFGNPFCTHIKSQTFLSILIHYKVAKNIIHLKKYILCISRIFWCRPK